MGRIRWQTVLLSVLAPAVAHAVVWDFEKDLSGWRPRSATLELTRSAAVGAAESSRSSLRVQGYIEGGWNYTLSDQAPMREGQRYRLSAWVRVDSVGAHTPMPYLKCEFVARRDGGTLGRATTDRYNNTRMGLWQQLSCEFDAPAGIAHGVVALEKGTSSFTEIDAYVDDVTLTPVEAESVFTQFRLPEVTAAAEAVRGVHPRLYLTDERIAELRQAIQTTHAPIWSEVRTLADEAVLEGPPAYVATDPYRDDEQLWQRRVGNALPYLALAYRLTGQKQYLEAVREWAQASCDYPTWGTGSLDGMDLATGHQLFGLALVYDWCHHDLDKPTLGHIRETMVRRGDALFQAAAAERVWWHRFYLQNHLWVNVCGLGTAGLALFDESDEAGLWAGLAVTKLATTRDALGPDGASHEGLGYWQYGAEYLLKFNHLAEDVLGIDLYDSPWWANTAKYCLYLSLPRAAWTSRNCLVDLADSPRYHWYGPDHILRHLAARYHDGHAQWLARQIDEANLAAPSASWLNLIWHDPSIPAKHPNGLPAVHWFDDMGIVSARSDWSGSEALVVFKCGPFIGHKAIEAFSYDPGGGHVHADAGHFVLFADGQWLVRDNGYRGNRTDEHNTLLVNGRGQIGEGDTSFAGRQCLSVRARPRIRAVVTDPEFDHLAGDVTEAYPKDLGLKRFVRHLLFLKPDVLLVLDEVLCDRESNLELRFHPESDLCEPHGSGYLMYGDRSTLRLELLTPEQVLADMHDPAVEGCDEAEDGPFALRFRTRRRHWRNATAISWAPIGLQPAVVTFAQAGDLWSFSVAQKAVLFDWNSGKAAIKP